MTAADLKSIIAQGETLTVEFKSDRDKLPDRALIEAAVALANTEGGLLFEGVEDKTGEITGLHRLHIGTGTPAPLIANRTNPPLNVSVEDVLVDGRHVFVISVPSVHGVTGTTDGVYLRRRLKPDGTPEAVPMSPFEIQSRASRFRLIDPSSQAMVEVPLSRIDPLQRERMRASIRRNNNSDKSLLELDDAAFDRALELVTECLGHEYLTLAGVLYLTDKATIRTHVPTYEVAFQVLRGTDVAVNDISRKPLVEAFDCIVERFEARIEEEEVIRAGYRMAAPNFDRAAFREALVNALVHRDYAVLGTVIVKLDDLGLTVYNPGGFVDGVRIDNLLSTSPRSRNALLADIAKRIGLAERTGRGVDRIFGGSLRYGRGCPGYDRSDATSVTLVIPREKADFDFLDFVNDYEKVTASSISVDLLLMVHALRARGKISFSDVVDLLQRKPELVREEITNWVEQNVLAPYGKGRGDSFVLSSAVQSKIGGKIALRRLTPELMQEYEQRIQDELNAKGMINRARIMSLCGVSSRQASTIIEDICIKLNVSKHGNGRSVHYEKNANGTQTI